MDSKPLPLETQIALLEARLENAKAGNAELVSKVTEAFSRILELQRLEESSRRVAENEAASAKKWREELGKENLQKYEAAAEYLRAEAKKIPLGAGDVQKGFSSTYNALVFCAEALERASADKRVGEGPTDRPCCVEAYSRGFEIGKARSEGR